MNSKTKSLKKGKYIPGSQPAPTTKVENTATTKHIARDKKKEIASRNHARRVRSMMKLGMTKEEISKVFENESVRMVLCLYYSNFTLEDGTKKIKVKNEEQTVPNILRGRKAIEKFLENNKIEPVATGATYCWIKSDKDNVDKIVEKLKPIGRTSITAPEKMSKEKLQAKEKEKRKAKQKELKKPSNNTEEAKKNAKAARKADNIKRAEMRSYYAAKRKGGVSTRIKKFNPTLAEKIEKWLKEQKKIEESRKKGSKEERAKHRQLTSMEMKCNKRARKAAKHLAAQERRREREKKRAEYNAKMRAERAQKHQKPVQTELKMAA